MIFQAIIEENFMPRGGKVKRYSQDFRQSAIELAMSGDTPVSRIARDLNMSEKTLHNWIKVHKDKNSVHPVGEIKKESMEEELKRLRKENALLKKEREILKKATAYFAKEAL